jgi:hypothetical protein
MTSTVTSYSSPVAEYINFTSYNGAVNMTEGFLRTITGLTIGKETSETSAPLFVNLTLQNAFSKRDFTDIIAQLKSALQQYSDVSSVVSSHESFNNYMKSIMTSICKWRYAKVIDGLKANVQTIDKEFTSAVNLLSNVSDNVIIDINSLCFKAIQKRLDKTPANKFLLETFFDNGNDMVASKRSLRYLLRQDMLSSFSLKFDNVPDANTLIIVKQIILDAYIISMYPYIHWLYLSAMLEQYKQKGNFNMMREAVFARATCTLFTLLSIYNKSQALSDGTSDFNADLTSLSGYISTVYTYIQNLTQIQFGNNNFNWSDLLNEVKKVSSDVSNKSLTIDQLKDQIQNLQLKVRADIITYKSVNSAYEWKTLQYKLLVVFLIFLIVIVGVMICMNVQITYVMYALSTLLALLLLLKAIETVIYLLRST